MITFACPACQKKLSVKDELAGKKGKCPACGQRVAIPSTVAAAPALEEMPTLPPSLGPAPSRQNERTNALTHPPSSSPDATQGGNKPDASHDSSLTDFLAPPQADDELGRLGKYRILKILGHGGMGVVYKAEDPKLKRSVAIKAMLPTLAASASAGKRFLREAQAMAAVKHDHIATIYQVEEERGIPYLAMEFLAGEPLDERLKKDGKLPLTEVLRIGREIAEGLDAAHATGLIHRDIKPANVWLEASRNRVKILDFGLARAVSEDSGLTQQGAIMGTPAFMAPEQGRGETVDARCDLFSLGVVLYRLCTGQQPFKGKDTISTIMEVALHQPPPPIQLDAEIPQALSDLVMKLLEKEPDQRPASAGEVVEMVQAVEKKVAGHKEAVGNTVALMGAASVAQLSENTTQIAPEPALRPRAKAGRGRTPLLVALGLVALVPLLWWLATVVLRVEPANGSLAADRKAAEWVLSIDGTVCVNGEEREINAAADLPRKSFRLTQVLLKMNKQVSDEGLAHFEGCKNLTVLDLWDTQVGNAGLAHFKGCKTLTQLDLRGTKVSDAGLAYFMDCKGLTHLTLNGTNVSDAGLAFFKDCKGLTSLTLTSTNVSDAGLALFKDCKGLTTLGLWNTNVSDAGLARFKDCKGLMKLNLGNTQVSDAGLAYFKGCMNLTVLILGNTKVSDAGLAYFMDCKGLTHLTLSNTQVSDMGLAYFKDSKNLTALFLNNTKVSDAGLALFKDCKGLTILGLNGTNVSDAGLAFFKDCKGLTKLNLTNTKVSDMGLAYFKECKSLTKLDLHNTKVSDMGLAYFKDSKNLTELFLNNTKVSDMGLAYFKECKSLTKLDLGNTQVSDAGLASFKNCKNLTELDLPGTMVSNAGLAPFKDCKNLAILRLQKTKVTQAKIEEFKKALPKCRIEWDGGVIEPRASLDLDRKAAEGVRSIGPKRTEGDRGCQELFFLL